MYGSAASVKKQVASSLETALKDVDTATGIRFASAASPPQHAPQQALAHPVLPLPAAPAVNRPAAAGAPSPTNNSGASSRSPAAPSNQIFLVSSLPCCTQG